MEENWQNGLRTQFYDREERSPRQQQSNMTVQHDNLTWQSGIAEED